MACDSQLTAAAHAQLPKTRSNTAAAEGRCRALASQPPPIDTRKPSGTNGRLVIYKYIHHMQLASSSWRSVPQLGSSNVGGLEEEEEAERRGHRHHHHRLTTRRAA